jgi:hypothetical protein
MSGVRFSSIVALAALLAPAVARADAPALVPLTGYLTDDSGAAVDDSVVLDVKFYDAGADGTELYHELLNVDVDQGQFTAYVGSVTPLPLDLFRDHALVYAAIRIDDGAEMAPRFQIATAPFAAYAQYSEDAGTVGGIDPGDLRLVTDPIPWTDVTSVPADLLDGDADHVYQAGTGITLASDTFAADRTTLEDWARGVAYDSLLELRTDLDGLYAARVDCTTDQVLLADATGAWGCVDATALPLSEAAIDSAVANNGYALASAVSSLTTRVATAETALTTVQGNVTTLQGNVGTLQTNVGALQTSVGALTTGGPYLPVAGGTATGTVTAPRFASTGQLSALGGKVRRDFFTFATSSSTPTTIHLKTNVKIQTNTMYRFLVEGYNYGNGAAVNSDAVGYTYAGWSCIGQNSVNNYAPGVTLSQYCSADGYVVLRLQSSSAYFLGFSVSGWFVNPTGTAFDVSAVAFQQTADL